MTDLTLTAAEIAHKLHQHFLMVLETWQAAGTATSQKLRNESQGMNATQILAADLKELGRYVICGDDRATRIELGLLVDCLSALYAKGDVKVEVFTADVLATELGIANVQNKGSRLLPAPDAVDLPLSLRINMDAEQLGLKVKETAGLRDYFVEFVHALILHDGLLTTEEILHGKQVEEILVALTERATKA